MLSVSANIAVAILCECVLVGHFLEASYRTGTRQRVGCDKSDIWSRRAGCYPTVNERFVNHYKYTPSKKILADML
jgi:hypothetical protein